MPVRIGRDIELENMTRERALNLFLEALEPFGLDGTGKTDDDFLIYFLMKATLKVNAKRLEIDTMRRGMKGIKQLGI